MGIRIEVEEGEPITDAIGRFRRLIRAPGSLSAQSLQVAQASAGHLPEAEHLEPPPTVE